MLGPEPVVTVVGCAWVGMLAIIWIVSGVISAVREQEQGPARWDACKLETHGYDSAHFIKLWEFGTPQFVLSVYVVVIFALRRFCFNYCVAALYPHLSKEKQEKCANYVMELVGTTVPLIVMSLNGFWDLLFYPGDLASALAQLQGIN